MIKSFTVKNYKALRDVTVELTPVHVLIGPNDAGKTSFLEAVAALSNSVDHPLVNGFPGRWKGAELVWRQKSNLSVLLQADIEEVGEVFSYQLGLVFDSATREVFTVRQSDDPFKEKGQGKDWSLVSGELGYTESFVRRHWRSAGSASAMAKRVHDALHGYHVYHLYGKHLAAPVAPGNQPNFQLWPSGFGLVHCLDDILSDNRDRFVEIEKEFVERFPEIKKIILRRERALAGHHDPFDELALSEAPGKALYLELRRGEVIPASQVSDGVLSILAYLTFRYLLNPPRILMVEEPENGIHPKRLEEVVKILRELVRAQQHAQVIVTTHSPYLLDHFSPEEVTFFKKGSDGAVTAHQLSKSKAVREQIDLFNLGEIWSAEGEERLAERVDPSEAKRS